MTDIKSILKQFGVDAPAKPFGNGHINTTYLVESEPRTILQRINTSIFTDPDGVMENIRLVTAHLRSKIIAEGGDPARETMTVIPTRDGALYYRTPEGDCYRLYTFVEGTVSPEDVDTPGALSEAARAFGHFQRMLADFPSEQLVETIPQFHDTPNRFRQLEAAIAADSAGRAASVAPEIAFAREYSKYASRITDAIADGRVPLRVTHNDTKTNNVLLDSETLKAVCVVDLDTVMPGSLLYDFGDSLRFGASTGAEDETDLSKIRFDLSKFEAFTKAFLSEVGPAMTEAEWELLPMSVLLMTLECGSRFLADHLNGDVYFRIHRENHNLDRCRTQFKLVAEIEAAFPEMKQIVDACRAER